MMPEIRFRQSEDKLEEYIKSLLSFKQGLAYDKCDTCRERGQGVYNVVTGQFTCVNCMAKKKWIEMVGPPCQY